VGVIQPSLRDSGRSGNRPTLERVGYYQVSLRERRTKSSVHSGDGGGDMSKLQNHSPRTRRGKGTGGSWKVGERPPGFEGSGAFFRRSFLMLLKKHHIQYDERYLWE
jgi:hypothetical protein